MLGLLRYSIEKQQQKEIKVKEGEGEREKDRILPGTRCCIRGESAVMLSYGKSESDEMWGLIIDIS